MDLWPPVRSDCRICGQRPLTTVLTLGNIALSNFVDDEVPVFASLTLTLCDPSRGGCSFVQLKERGIDPETLYRRYWYRSAVNESMRDALADVATCVTKAAQLQAGDVLVDIGANDGTLLRAYEVPGLHKIGFEPARNITMLDDESTVVRDFFNQDRYHSVIHGGQRAKAVTAIAMFYDLEEPNAFVRDVRNILADDGVFVIQMAYLPSMLESNAFDNVCHEHIGYYSLHALMALLKRHELAVRDVTLNSTNGGSFRVYVQHGAQAQAPWAFPGAETRIAACLAREQRDGLDVYQAFAARVAHIKSQVVGFVDERLAAGDTFHVYGASTKGNTLLQVFGLDSGHIAAAAERNVDKFGRRTVATDIPIVSEAESRAARPDYYLVLPWHFREGIVHREAEYLDNGGRLLFPLPTPELVLKADGVVEVVPLADAPITT